MKRYSDRLFVSFSGGETSAYMTQWLLPRWQDLGYQEMVILFANTGQENEETLSFVDQFSRHHGFAVTWIEADLIDPKKFKVVDFATASRNGEPFEQVIARYGLPNSSWPQCTRDLKLYPMERYLRSIGWSAGTYDTAIGIRSDEVDRVSASAERRKVVYPLISAQPMTKPKINFWFSTQPFRLALKGYEGNCKWCWKKSKRKHLTLIEQAPDWFSFPARMEHEYGTVGAEFLKEYRPGYRRTFFRGNQSTEDLFREHSAMPSDFAWASDDSIVFDSDLDVGGGCGDSEACEIFTDDNESCLPEDSLWTWLTAA